MSASGLDTNGVRGKITFLVALIGHAALLLLLSLAWSKQAPREWPKPQSMEVSLVADVAPEATAPPSPDPPAPSIAPEQGEPQEAPPPAPAAVARPEPVKPAPATRLRSRRCNRGPRPPPRSHSQRPPPKPAPAKPVARPSRLTD